MSSESNYSFVMAERLRALREARGLSHDKLSKALSERYNIGISSDSLMNYEVADANHTKKYKNVGMRVEYLRCLAEFYGVSTDYLLGLAEEQTPDQTIQAVCRYTGLTEFSAEYLHAYKGSSKGFLTRLIDDILQIDGIGSTVPDLVFRSAEALLLAAQDSEFGETRCDIDNRIAYASRSKGCQYVISAKNAAELYLTQAIEITKSKVESTISEMCMDAASFMAEWQGDDGAEFFQWIKVDDSELPEDQVSTNTTE